MCSNVSLVSETEKITTRKDRNLTSHTYQLGKKVGVWGGGEGGDMYGMYIHFNFLPIQQGHKYIK